MRSITTASRESKAPLSKCRPGIREGESDLERLRKAQQEEDRTEGEEADDSPENIRRIRVVGVTEEENGSSTDAAKLRRKWEILPVRRSMALYTRS